MSSKKDRAIVVSALKHAAPYIRLYKGKIFVNMQVTFFTLRRVCDSFSHAVMLLWLYTKRLLYEYPLLRKQVLRSCGNRLNLVAKIRFTF